MADITVMLGCLVTGLLILRSLGGEGVNISFRLEPITSKKGRKQHLTIWLALSVIIVGIAQYFIQNKGAGLVSLVVIPAILGGLVALLADRGGKKEL